MRAILEAMVRTKVTAAGCKNGENREYPTKELRYGVSMFADMLMAEAYPKQGPL